MATYGYLRVSTNQQCLENQRSEILRFAQSHELVIDKWISEHSRLSSLCEEYGVSESTLRKFLNTESVPRS